MHREVLGAAGEPDSAPCHEAHVAAIEVTLHGRLTFISVGPNVVDVRSEHEADRKFRQRNIEGEHLVRCYTVDRIIPCHRNGRISALGVEVDRRAILIPDKPIVSKYHVFVVVLNHTITTFHLRSTEDQFHARLATCPPDAAELHRRVDTPQSGF